MTSSPVARGPYAKGVARKREILGIALALLANDGLRRSTLDEIAQRAGVSRQGLLHYFGSREGLLIAVLEARDADDIAAAAGASRPAESMADALERMLLRTTESPGLTRLYTTLAAEATDPDHFAHAFFRDRYRRVRTMIRDGVRGEQAAGRVDESVDPEAASYQILAVLDGLQLQWLLDPRLDTRLSMRAAVEALLPAGPGA